VAAGREPEPAERREPPWSEPPRATLPHRSRPEPNPHNRKRSEHRRCNHRTLHGNDDGGAADGSSPERTARKSKPPHKPPVRKAPGPELHRAPEPGPHRAPEQHKRCTALHSMTLHSSDVGDAADGSSPERTARKSKPQHKPPVRKAPGPEPHREPEQHMLNTAPGSSSCGIEHADAP